MAGTIPENCRDWLFAGFLDGRRQILDKYPSAGPILGNPESYEIKENDLFVCAIGSIDDLRKYAELIEKRGGLFANVIHPSAVVGERTKIGVGCIVWPNAIITTDVTIGNHVSVHPNVVVAHDAVIGSFSILSAGSFVGGHAKLDEEVFLKHGAVVASRNDVQRGQHGEKKV
jgi:UDP-3-O-[3-hydroxymyristoyl] glucosamine N-acyltransferase